MSVDPAAFSPVAAFPFPDDRFVDVWCSFSTSIGHAAASGVRPTTPSVAAP